MPGSLSPGDWRLLAGQEQMLGWSSVRLGAVSPLTVILAVAKKPHCLELNATALEGVRRGRCPKPSPCLAASNVGTQGYK